MTTDKRAILLTAAEIKEYRNQLDIKQAQFLEENKVFNEECEAFFRQKAIAEFHHNIKIIRQKLSLKENNLHKETNEHSLKTNGTTSNIDINHSDTASSPSSSSHYGRQGYFDVHTSTAATCNVHCFASENLIPQISFRDVLEKIPWFDGQNMPLLQFLRACLWAKEIFPPSSEKILTRLLLTKLRGRAACVVEDEVCESITQLSDLLNSAFGPLKTIGEYRGELSSIYIKRGENINDYISRVKDLRFLILDMERRTRGSLTDEISAEIDALTAHSFCEGLPLNIRIQLISKNYSNPFAAFSQARYLVKRQELENKRLKNSIFDNSQFGFSKAVGNWRTSKAESPVAGKTQYRNTSSARKFCRYCKNQGHEIEECRKRQYNNSRRAQKNFSFPSRESLTDEPRAETCQVISHPVKTIVTE